MVNIMDETVGDLTQALKQRGLWDNTLIVFSSDNGGPVDVQENAANNWPLRGGKYSVFEGGIRATAFVSGGFIPPALRGTRNDGIISIADWYSTFCKLAGVDPTDTRGSHFKAVQKCQRYFSPISFKIQHHQKAPNLVIFKTPKFKPKR